jgi:flagellar hook-associated protein 1 FlgK
MSVVNPNFFNTAVTGLNYASSALAVVSNNISNSSQAGYTREVVTNVNPTGGGAGGVLVGERQTSVYLNANLINAQSNASEQGAYAQYATQLNTILASTTATGTSNNIATDIGGSIQNFFSSVNRLATTTGDATGAARNAVLTNATILTSQFSSVGNQINSLSSQVEQNINSDIGSINALAKQIASVNQNIQQAQGQSLIQPPNNLQDQRDQLLQKLSKLVGVTTLPQSDGTYSVFIGQGQALVLGTTAQNLQGATSSTDPSKTILSYSSPNGPIAIPDNQVVGGELGALVQFRAQTLAPAAQALGQLSTSFAATINNQLALGRDQNQKQGAPMFGLPLIPSSAATTNTGNGVLAVTMTNPALTYPSDYSVKFDGTNYTITRISDGSGGVDTNGSAISAATTYSSLPQTVDGLNFSLSSGQMQAGDAITVYPYDQTMGGVKVIMTNGANIAAAGGAIAVSANATNAGSGSLAITGLTGTLASNLPSSTANVKFVDSTHYQVQQGSGSYGESTALVNNQVTVNGVTMTLTGYPKSGDTFSLGPNNFGIADNSNVAALDTLQTSSTLLGNTTNFSSYYSSIIGTVGLAGQLYQATSQAANNSLTTATTSQQTVSGVNLDEEAANLLNYQRQYQASAKVITVASSLFQSLLQI